MPKRTRIRIVVHGDESNPHHPDSIHQSRREIHRMWVSLSISDEVFSVFSTSIAQSFPRRSTVHES